MQQCHKHIVSNNELPVCSKCDGRGGWGEGLEHEDCYKCGGTGNEVAVCPECKSKDIRPYRDHYCCYECGNYFRQTDC